MPVHPKWRKVLSSMIEQYGNEKGAEVFYATMKKKGIDYTQSPEKELKYNSGLELKEIDGTYYIEGFVSAPDFDLEGDRMLSQESIAEQIKNNSESKKGSLHHDRTGSALLIAEETDVIDGRVWIKTKVNPYHIDYDKNCLII